MDDELSKKVAEKYRQLQMLGVVLKPMTILHVKSINEPEPVKDECEDSEDEEMFTSVSNNNGLSSKEEDVTDYEDDKVHSCLNQFLKCQRSVEDITNKSVPVKESKSALSHAFRCSACNLLFFDINELQIHGKTHSEHDTRQILFKCSVCKKLLKTFERLNLHNKAHAKNQAIYDCTVCEDEFLSKEESQKHYLTHFKDVINDILTKQIFKSNKLRESKVKKIWRCELCNRRLMNEKYYNAHMNIHNMKLLKCPACLKEFTNGFILKRHMKIHSMGKIHKCPVCNKGFLTRRDCERHHQIHTGEKPFACSVCEKKFRLKTSLQAHMLSHSKERPFKCSLCEKSFKHKPFLSIHLKRHKEKSVLCEECGQSFFDNTSLKLHATQRHSTIETPHSVLKSEKRKKREVTKNW